MRPKGISGPRATALASPGPRWPTADLLVYITAVAVKICRYDALIGRRLLPQLVFYALPLTKRLIFRIRLELRGLRVNKPGLQPTAEVALLVPW